MQFERFADDTGLDNFHRAAQARFGAALLPICVASFLYSPIPDNAGFLDGLNERFLAKTVLAHLHARIAATRGVVRVETVTASISFPTSSSIFR